MAKIAKSLNPSDWTLRAIGDLSHIPDELRSVLTDGVPATVPGCVHTDLLAATLIDDPYLADHELRQFWIGNTDWQYECRFTADDALIAEEHLELVCEGLDTVAAVFMNRVRVGQSANMHTLARFDVRPAIQAGDNEVRIRFAAPRIYAKAQEAIYGALPHTGNGSNAAHPHNMMRKMACNFGWDWGPDVVTSGIWRPIRLEAWSVARVDYLRPAVERIDGDRLLLRVHVDAVGNLGRATVHAQLRSPAGDIIDGHIRDAGRVAMFVVERPRLWWPVGHGDQPLYDLEVTLTDGAGPIIDVMHRRIGLRTTELETKADEKALTDAVPGRTGESMTLKINGKPIYCKGANWIPDDCFPHRVTPPRDANMNMLRVWGGGVYEGNAFYEICDEMGLLVWQDFMFACAFYPEEEPYRSLVEEEIRQNVSRLASHPSVVLWNGCNENLVAAFDWGEAWSSVRLDATRTWGRGYYFDLIPKVLAELDPSRPYWPAVRIRAATTGRRTRRNTATCTSGTSGTGRAITGAISRTRRVCRPSSAITGRRATPRWLAPFPRVSGGGNRP